MPRWNPLRRSKPDEIGKQVAIQEGRVSQGHDFTALIDAITRTGAKGPTFPFNALPRDPQDNNTFGPGRSFIPAPLDPTRPDGRADPRYGEYPVTWNLDLLPAPHIPFQTLREASEKIDLVRRCITKRQKEIVARDWSFSIAPWAINLESAKNPSTPTPDIVARLTKEYADDIQKANAFWQFPGKNQDYSWDEWLYAALEEYLTIDAICVFPQRTYGGDLYSLDLIDGATIKPLRDKRGGKPAWPFPAFQQILYGLPRGEHTATFMKREDGTVVIPDAYQRDQMYYIRRCNRVRSMYGFSATEQALISARLYLKRQGWMLSEYDDGTVPMAWIESVLNNGDIEMDANQRRMWEEALNDELSGNTSARHRLKVMPPGMKAVETSSVDERYKPDYDLFLIKLMATHFDVPISELGFPETQGLGSSGFHESQGDTYERSATLPDTRWFSKQVSRISHEQLGIRPEVIHKFAGIDSEDEAAQDQVWENRVGSGRATVNEDRARLNLPLFGFAEANMPFIKTNRGVLFISGASKLAPSGVTVEPPAQPPAIPGAPAPAGGAKPAAAKPAAKKPTSAAKLAELSAFNKWAKGRPLTDGYTGRQFTFEHVTTEDAPDLADDPRVVWST